jgi:hypothetical protein
MRKTVAKQKPTSTANRRKKAIVTTPYGSVYEDEKYPPSKPWLKPIDAMKLADKVEWLRTHEDDPPEDEATLARKQKQNERARSRPKRHQKTTRSFVEAVALAGGTFAAEYPHQRLPFTKVVKEDQRPRTAAGIRIVIRRHRPLGLPFGGTTNNPHDKH